LETTYGKMVDKIFAGLKDDIKAKDEQRLELERNTVTSESIVILSCKDPEDKIFEKEIRINLENNSSKRNKMILGKKLGDKIKGFPIEGDYYDVEIKKISKNI